MDDIKVENQSMYIKIYIEGILSLLYDVFGQQKIQYYQIFPYYPFNPRFRF